MGKTKHATFYGVCISSILLFPICMEIQQVLVSVVTQHLQLVVGQILQQQETHPLQLAKAYRPPRPQIQVILHVVQVSVACSNVALAAKVTHFNSFVCYRPWFNYWWFHWWYCCIDLNHYHWAPLLLL